MKIGFVSMPYSGHLNPMIALARKLEARGHDIVFFGIEDAAATVQAANLKFHAVARKEFPLGGSAGYLEQISKLRGREILRFSFPWERVTAERLIYASLGTLVNGLEHVYRKIIAASALIPGTQLVLSIGNNIRLEDLGTLPGNAIVVRSAPQLELLKRAHLCITHGGANTVLESLAAGVPMIAIPIGFDQPGVAARVAYHGVGEFLAEEDLTSDKLKALITTVMDDPNYKTRVVQMRDEIAASRGLERAVTIIEQTLEEALHSEDKSERDRTELLYRWQKRKISRTADFLHSPAAAGPASGAAP